MSDANELIAEGLRRRQEHGVAAALDCFNRAAQLEPNSHLPFFMRLRASLSTRFEQAPLRDEKRFAANFEQALRTAWRDTHEKRVYPVE